MGAPDGGTYLGLCEVCNGEPDWHLTRRGDVVTSWACSADLAQVLVRLQRPQDNPTEVVVTPSIERRVDTAIERILDDA